LKAASVIEAPMNSAPRQLPLAFAAPEASLENFVVGQNAELLARLRALEIPRVLYLWGDAGSGKTHLLNAVRTLHGEHVLVTDNAQCLDAAGQEVLFDAFNATLLGAPPLVVAGERPPLQLQMREDLRTRLGAGLVYALHALSDDEKRIALTQAAHARGLTLSEDFITYVLTHFSRDMRSLMGMLDALDRYALATQRALTLPLLRQWLQHEMNFE
jgi:DnaA family protein